MKRYRLWCFDPKSLKLIICIDVSFDELFMLYPKKELLFSSPVDTCIRESDEEKVEQTLDASS